MTWTDILPADLKKKLTITMSWIQNWLLRQVKKQPPLTEFKPFVMWYIKKTILIVNHNIIQQVAQCAGLTADMLFSPGS